MELFIIIALVLLNGVFALSEMALVSSRKFKLESMQKRGSKGAGVALEMSENPTKFLSTVQIGITLIGILLGVYGGENLTQDIRIFLEQYEWIRPYAGTASTILLVVFITYLSIVLGELFPKRVGMLFPESLISLLAAPMHLLSVVTSPFVWLLTATNNFLLKIFGLRKEGANRITEEEIKSMIKESAEGGEIQNIEQDIVERVFELGDRRVKTLLTHRLSIVYFKMTDTWDEVRKKIEEEKHSAYPVSNSQNLDDIVGIVMLKDLFIHRRDKAFEWQEYLKKPLFVNESTYAYRLLELFRTTKMHYAIVVDEYGSTVGMVTLDDVVDALVGDMADAEDDEPTLVQRDERSWLVDGQYSIFEFAKYFQIDLEKFGDIKFSTVAGLIIFLAHKLPDTGDKVDFGNYTLEVIDKDKQRIDKVLVSKQ